MKILIVEDDPIVAKSLNLLLGKYNYSVDIASDAEIGLDLVAAYDYDLLVLDRGLPGMDGVSLCQRLRAERHQMPILLLTGQGREGYRQAEALNAGADDYLMKPFDVEEFIARLQALLRRSSGNPQPILTWGGLSLDPSNRQVDYEGQALLLTPKEYSILELLLRHPQTVFSARSILDHAWDSTDAPGEEVVRYHIKELRHKLSAAAAPKALIETVHRVGYRLNPIFASPESPRAPLQKDAPPSDALPSSAQGNGAPSILSQVADLTSRNQQLCIALEALQRSGEDLRQRMADLQGAQRFLTTERNYYRDLFQFAPAGYLVSDSQGTIEEANQAAASLLGVEPPALICQALSNFVAAAERQSFQDCLGQLSWPNPWTITLHPHQGHPVSVLIAITTIVDAQQGLTGLRWLLRAIPAVCS